VNRTHEIRRQNQAGWQTHEGLRVWHGDKPPVADPENADALSIRSSRRQRVMHSFFGGGIDENIEVIGSSSSGPNSIEGPVMDVVIDRCIYALSLDKSIHPKGRHGCGAILGYFATRVLFRRCLSAHNWVRGLFDVTVDRQHVLAEAQNCVVYNWGMEGFKCASTPAGAAGGFRALVNLRRCVFVEGPDSELVKGRTFKTERQLYHIEDCIIIRRDGSRHDLRDWLSDEDRAALSPIRHNLDWRAADKRYHSLLPVETTLRTVLMQAGPRGGRSVLEQMVVDDVRNRTGKLIDSNHDLIERML
jgi:hypothetical protein